MTDFDRQSARQALRTARRALAAPERISAALAIAHHLQDIPELGEAVDVAGYWACDGEVPLHALLVGKPRFRYLLPQLQPGKRMDFARWAPGDAVLANRFGIPEPVTGEVVPAQQIDVILMPLLGFHRNGARLGSGGGYYDRALAFLRARERPAKPLLIGIGYALQEVPALIAEPWDIAMDFVATERELIRCRALAQ